uniref:Uncharacterized protein n=1 Tax=Pediastrum duplex TaxID=3105 RepID=A0A2U8GJS9_PEDDU|nr:hypothetical protein [Pediastrum duplex]
MTNFIIDKKIQNIFFIFVLLNIFTSLCFFFQKKDSIYNQFAMIHWIPRIKTCNHRSLLLRLCVGSAFQSHVFHEVKETEVPKREKNFQNSKRIIVDCSDFI